MLGETFFLFHSILTIVSFSSMFLKAVLYQSITYVHFIPAILWSFSHMPAWRNDFFCTIVCSQLYPFHLYFERLSCTTQLHTCVLFFQPFYGAAVTCLLVYVSKGYPAPPNYMHIYFFFSHFMELQKHACLSMFLKAILHHSITCICTFFQPFYGASVTCLFGEIFFCAIVCSQLYSFHLQLCL